jgi:hypothetical protein
MRAVAPLQGPCAEALHNTVAIVPATHTSLASASQSRGYLPHALKCTCLGVGGVGAASACHSRQSGHANPEQHNWCGCRPSTQQPWQITYWPWVSPGQSLGTAMAMDVKNRPTLRAMPCGCCGSSGRAGWPRSGLPYASMYMPPPPVVAHCGGQHKGAALTRARPPLGCPP